MGGDDGLRTLAVEAGLGAGLDRVGVCGADPFPDVIADLEMRKADGRSGGLGFTYSRPREAGDIRRTYPWARSVVVGLRAYLPQAGDPGAPTAGSARVARFATEDHYVPLRRALEVMAGVLRSRGTRAEVMVDDSRLVDRAVAVRAGVGWWGKNSMVLAPGLGPWFLIGSVVTDADLPFDQPMKRDCGNCTACLPACPTGALVEPGILDASRCLATLLQMRGPIPIEYRVHVADRLYGCDDCLDACPPGSKLLAASTERRVGRHDARRLLALSDEELLERFDHFYVPGRKARYLRRNLIVVLGNTGTAEEEPLLGDIVNGSPDALLRAHAAWALGRLAGERARRALATAVNGETDPEVRYELELALASAAAPPMEE